MGIRTIVFFLTMYTFILEKKVPNIILMTVFILILFLCVKILILFIILFQLFYFLFKSSFKTIFKNFLIFLLFGIFIFYFMPLLLDYLPAYSQNKIKLVYNLISSLDSKTILLLAERDGSFFLRFFNPIIGLEIFSNNLCFF